MTATYLVMGCILYYCLHLGHTSTSSHLCKDIRCLKHTGNQGSLMAIGGYNMSHLSSAEVLSTSCDFPLPEARSAHMSVTTTDGKTLVCGGGGSHRFTASCLQFNLQSKTWEQHSYLRSKYREFGSMIELTQGVYAVGGRSVQASISSEFLATGSTEWTQGPHIPGRGVYGSCGAKLSDTEFVILGGAFDGRQARVYDEETGEWREWPRLTMDVTGQSCMGLGDIVLMAGGYSHGYTATTVIFDTKTGSAREVTSLKYPRGWASMVLYRGKALILGGKDGSGVKSDGEMWNMDTETWEEADIHLNIARDSFSLVTMASEIGC